MLLKIYFLVSKNIKRDSKINAAFLFLSNRAQCENMLILNNFMATKIHNSLIDTSRNSLFKTVKLHLVKLSDFVVLHKGSIYSLEWSYFRVSI